MPGLAARGMLVTMKPPAWDQLNTVRRNRVRAAPSLELRRLFLVEVPEMRRLKKQLSAAAAAWEQVIPPELAERTRLEGVSRGVLRVAVSDSATAYELDRLLRSGAEAALLAQVSVALRSVRVVVTSG